MEERRDIEKLKIEFEVVVTNEDIDDIMCSALEGGITYWCCNAEVIGEYLGEYGSEQISRGGKLRLYDSEEDKAYELTRGKFMKGLKMYFAKQIAGGFLDSTGHGLCLDPGYADAFTADAIIQYALFDDVIYG